MEAAEAMDRTGEGRLKKKTEKKTAAKRPTRAALKAAKKRYARALRVAKKISVDQQRVMRLVDSLRALPLDDALLSATTKKISVAARALGSAVESHQRRAYLGARGLLA